MKRRLMQVWNRLWSQGKEQKGFTLIELAVALAILGILVAIAVPTYLSVRNRSYDSEAKQMLGEIRSLAWSYFLEQNGWPDDLDTLKYSGSSDNWTFSLSEGSGESLDIKATGKASPTNGRCWVLNLNEQGTAKLEGPDACS